MKSTKLLLMGALLLLMVITACQKDESPEAKAKDENQFVRLLVADFDNSTISFITPFKNETETFTSQFAAGAIYPTASGRFAAVLNTANNHVQFFDSGIEGHGDHAHKKGTSKWAKTIATAPRPTHLYASGNYITIFNGGDGSLSLTREEDLHTAEKADHLVIDRPHHGAAVRFDNGTFAVTEKDNTVAGTLPERVKIVSSGGNVVHASAVATKGIHGEGSNGTMALFGSVDGVLKVGDNGSQSLIAYPESFGSKWIGTIYYGKAADRFVGYISKYGVYFISPQNNTITTVIESENIVGARFDHEGKDILVLQNDGTCMVFDGVSGTKKAERKLPLVFPADNKIPAFTASKGYVYVTNPEQAEVLMLNKDNLSDFRKFAVPGRPGRISLVGADVSEESDD
jgi:hypothetical protein